MFVKSAQQFIVHQRAIFMAILGYIWGSLPFYVCSVAHDRKNSRVSIKDALMFFVKNLEKH